MGPAFRTTFERSAGLAAALAIACALGSCSVAPVPSPKADTPPEWRHAPADDAALGAAPDLEGWWRAFGDPVLDALVERALADNLTLKQAGYRIAAARAMTGPSAAEFRPGIDARTFAQPAPDSSASYFQAGFDAKWELGLFGRAQSHARLAAADVGLAESDAAAARVSVVAEVVRTYLELRAAERRLDLLGRIAESARAKSMLIATRERLRLASSADTAGSEAEHAAAEAALTEPRLAIDRCRQQLAVLLGRSEPDAGDVPDGPQPTLGALRIAVAPADLVRTRPEIRSAELAILKAAGELGIARADLYPRLALGGSLTTSARVIGHTRLSDADSIATFGPLIDVPIFDWGARRAIVDARDAELEAAVIGYRQAVLEGVAEAETAMATLERQRERVRELDRAVSALERGDAASATLRRVGLADDVDRESAAAELLKAKLEAADAEAARNLAFVALYKALGGAPMPSAEPPA